MITECPAVERCRVPVQKGQPVRDVQDGTRHPGGRPAGLRTPGGSHQVIVVVVCTPVDPHSFFADPDPAVILNKDPYKICKKINLKSVKKKMAQKLKTIELVHIYFIFKNKSTIITVPVLIS